MSDIEKIRNIEKKSKLESQVRQLKTSLGLCRHCTAKVMPGYKKCEAHVLRDRRNAKRRYDSKKAAGICLYCDKPAEGLIYCKVHLVYYRNKIAQRRRRKKDVEG